MSWDIPGFPWTSQLCPRSTVPAPGTTWDSDLGLAGTPGTLLKKLWQPGTLNLANWDFWDAPGKTWDLYNKANLRDLIAATGLIILLKLDSNRLFSQCDLEIWWMTPENNPAPLLCYFKLFASFRSHWWIETGVTVRKRQIWVKFDDFLAVWPWNLTDDLEKNRAHLLSYFKLCVSFHTHWWIQTGVTVQKRPIWVKIDFFSRVTFKLDGWPWKTIGHLFYDTLSFVHHFNAIGKFKLKLTSRKRSIRVKIKDFF